MKRTLPLDKFLQAGPAGDTVMATCIDSEGRANIITLGMYMSISFKPPLVCIGVSPKRYSHDLIAEAGEFVVNIPSIDLAEETHFCGTKSGRDVDKFEEAGLTPAPASKVRPPLVKECYGNLECKVVQSHVCGDHTLFVGEVLNAVVDDEVLSGGNLDPLKAKPIISKNHIYYTVTDSK